MRVLHIGTEMTWRGGENQVRLLMEGLRARGIESILAYPSGSQAIARLKAHFKVVELASRSPLDPRNRRRLRQAVNDHGVEVIDAHSAGAHALALQVKRSQPRLKVVVHRRVDNPIRSGFLTRRKYLGGGVDAFVAISNAIGEILKNYGVEESRIHVVKSAVDPEVFADLDRARARAKWRASLKLPADALLVGNASALTAQKGYDVLLKALALLKKEGLPIHCAIAGDGVLREQLLQLAQALDLRKDVQFLGFLHPVADFLASLDILCVPSNNEGLGTVILDGLWAGVCVVATRVGGIPEMIIDGHTGLLSEKGDVEALARNLRRALTDGDLRRRFVAEAQKHLKQNFSLNSMVDGNLRVYRRALASV